MDAIFIEDLRLQTRVGLYPREKIMPQTVALDLEIKYALPAGGLQDNIRAAIDYVAVADFLRSELAKSRCNLLETLAEIIAALILEKFSARSVRVRLSKPGVMKNAGRVGVTIERDAKSDAPQAVLK